MEVIVPCAHLVAAEHLMPAGTRIPVAADILLHQYIKCMCWLEVKSYAQPTQLAVYSRLFHLTNSLTRGTNRYNHVIVRNTAVSASLGHQLLLLTVPHNRFTAGTQVWRCSDDAFAVSKSANAPSTTCNHKIAHPNPPTTTSSSWSCT